MSVERNPHTTGEENLFQILVEKHMRRARYYWRYFGDLVKEGSGGK